MVNSQIFCFAAGLLVKNHFRSGNVFCNHSFQILRHSSEVALMRSDMHHCITGKRHEESPDFYLLRKPSPFW